MMHDFSETTYYKSWINHTKGHKRKLIFWVNIMHVAIWLLGLKKVNKLIKFFFKPKLEQYFLTADKAAVFATYTRPTLRYIRKNKWLLSNCLSSSLLFWLLLYRQGLIAELVIGCNTRKKFVAHAWLEVEGVALNGGKHIRKRYQTFNYNFSILNY